MKKQALRSAPCEVQLASCFGPFQSSTLFTLPNPKQRVTHNQAGGNVKHGTSQRSPRKTFQASNSWAQRGSC